MAKFEGNLSSESKPPALPLFGFRALSFFRHSVFGIRIFEMVSVAGLAPARLCLKGRLRELLCIHGHRKWNWIDGLLYAWIDGKGSPRDCALTTYPIIQSSSL